VDGANGYCIESRISIEDEACGTTRDERVFGPSFPSFEAKYDMVKESRLEEASALFGTDDFLSDESEARDVEGGANPGEVRDDTETDPVTLAVIGNGAVSRADSDGERLDIAEEGSMWDPNDFDVITERELGMRGK